MKIQKHFFIGILTLMFVPNQVFGQLTLVDYLSQSTVTVQELTNCSFEQVCSEVDTTTSLGWQIGTPSKTKFDSAYSVSNAIVTDTLNNYPINTVMHFDLEVQNNIPHANLIEFWHKLDSDTLLDGGFIEVSKDSGVTWVNLLAEFQNNPNLLTTENFYSFTDTLFNHEKGFSGSIHEWKKVRILIDWSYPVKTSWPLGNFQLRFNFISDTVETNKEGWMIDNLTVSEVINSLSIAEENQINPLIYPNPAKETITLDIPSSIDFSTSLTFKVMDLTGREIQKYKITTNQTSLDIQNWSTGVYSVLLINDDNILHTQKIIKL